MEEVPESVEAKATRDLQRDQELLEKLLEVKHKHEFMIRKDPEKVRLEKERNRHMKKTALQKTFHADEEEDTDKFQDLLEKTYKNNKMAR